MVINYSNPDELLIVGGVEEKGVEKCVVVTRAIG